MRSIPLIRSHYLLPLVEYLQDSGVSAVDFCADAGVPLWAPDFPNRPISMLPIMRLISQVEDSGVSNLAARASAGQSPLLVARVASKLRLFLSTQLVLREFCRCAAGEVNTSDFSLVEFEDGVLFKRTLLPETRNAPDPLEPFILQLMLGVVRLGVGPNWKPGRVFLRANSYLGLDEVSDFADSRIRLRSGITALTVSSRTLHQHSHLWSLGPGPAAASSPGDIDVLERSFLPACRQLVASYLLSGECRLEEIASAIGMCTRSFQRHLATEGTTFSRVVDHERMRLAHSFLDGAEPSVTEIAFCLGYSDPSHFTRAFRRWYGVTPSRVRIDAGHRRRAAQRRIAATPEPVSLPSSPSELELRT